MDDNDKAVFDTLIAGLVFDGWTVEQIKEIAGQSAQEAVDDFAAAKF